VQNHTQHILAAAVAAVEQLQLQVQDHFEGSSFEQQAVT
jgi:hypothetical protein